MLKENRIIITVVLLLSFAALILGIFVAQYVHPKKNPDLNLFHGTLLKESRTIKDFSLKGIDKHPFSAQNLEGHWTFMFFGFTQCSYLCPTSMAELAKMYRLLQEKNITPLPHVVFISIDPAHDSLEKIKAYVQAFNPYFYGATAEEKNIRSMTKELGIAYEQVHAINAPQQSDLQHSGVIILFNPQGKVTAFFTTPHNAQKLVEDYQLLIS